LGPEAGARLTSVPSNSIVERFADVVDVLATTIGGEVVRVDTDSIDTRCETRDTQPPTEKT